MPAVDTYGVFYTHPKLDGQHFYDTKEERYKDVTMVEIFIKGNTKASISKEVFSPDGNPAVASDGETYLEKFPKAWAMFNREAGVELDGTPLKNMGGIGPGQILNLNAQGVETVEDLANLNDNVVIGEPGMLDMRNKARAYMAALHPEKAMAAEKAKEEEMQNLRKEIQQMKEALENATIPPEETKPKRGRPRKT